MKKIKIQHQLTFTYIFVILLTITLTGILFLNWINKFLILNVENTLRSQAHSVSKMLGGYAWNQRDLRHSAFIFAENFEQKGKMIFKICDTTGMVLANSASEDINNIETINEEALKALMGEEEVKWTEQINGETFIHITVPIITWKETIGLVDVSTSLNEINHLFSIMAKFLGFATIFSVIVVSVIGFIIARTVTNPISKIKNIAVKISQGDLNQKINPVKNPAELSELGDTINYMAGQLKSFIGQITNEKNKINAILKNVIDGLIAIDMDKNVIFINGKAETFLGWKNEKATGKPLLEIWPKEEIHNIIDESIKTNTIVKKEINIIQKPPVILHFTIAPFRDEQNEHPGILIIFRDITELRKLETARSEFFSNVSHELRTPLTIIKGFSATLQDEYPPEKEIWQHALNTIEEETDRLTRMVNDMLELSRFRNYRIELKMETGDIKELLLQIIEQFRLRAERYQIKLTCEISEDLPRINFDRDKMKQVFINLLDNAIKYTPSEGEINLKAWQEEGKIYVKMSDTGTGVKEEEIPFLFERYFRGEKNKDNVRGTGLGLPIAKEIIKAHGGEITLKNNSPSGLEVNLWINI